MNNIIDFEARRKKTELEICASNEIRFTQDLDALMSNLGTVRDVVIIGILLTYAAKAKVRWGADINVKGVARLWEGRVKKYTSRETS